MNTNGSLLEQARGLKETFGFNIWLFVAQFLSVLVIVLAVFVTIYAMRIHRANPQLPKWLLLTWLFPIIGPVCAYLALRAQSRRVAGP